MPWAEIVSAGRQFSDEYLMGGREPNKEETFWLIYEKK